VSSIKIEDQIAEQALKDGGWVGSREALDRMRAAVAAAIRKDRERST
jgi:hypothetical protein